MNLGHPHFKQLQNAHGSSEKSACSFIYTDNDFANHKQFSKTHVAITFRNEKQTIVKNWNGNDFKNSLIQITRVLKEVEICEIEMLGLSRQTLSDDLIMTA